nr:hypothetical protein [Pseudoalteromonas shioyasakiensis]
MIMVVCDGIGIVCLTP